MFIHWKKPDGSTADTSVNTAAWETEALQARREYLQALSGEAAPETPQPQPDPITDQKRRDYVSALAAELQATGAVPIDWVMLGVFDQPPPIDLADQQHQLVERIDTRAALIYSRWTRFEAEYRVREIAAQAFKDASYQGEPGLYVTSFAEPAGLTTRAATDAILAQAAALRAAQDALSALRMRKYEVARSTTIEAAQVLTDQIIAAMDEIAREVG